MREKGKLLEKKALKMRHELKYNINQGEDFLLASRLKRLFSHDKNAGSHGGYRVTSLYFDTPYDQALKEKNDGVKMREKFRLRYYGENKEFIRLEKKMKKNGLCAKRSTVLTRAQAEKIVKGEVDFLIESKDALLVEFYSKLKGRQLKPKKVVVYDREAFVYGPGNVRITLDRNLKTTMNPLLFLKERDADEQEGSHRSKIALEPGITVLEIKYDEFLPDLVKLAVQGYARGNTAFSKYAVSRKYE